MIRRLVLINYFIFFLIFFTKIAPLDHPDLNSIAHVFAQDDTNANNEITRDQVNDVARNLWCPLCSGVRLDTCELKACVQMRDEIAIRLSNGDSTEEIISYFEEQYGPQVFGEPPREGFNWLAWIVPFAVLIGGGIYLIAKRPRNRTIVTGGASQDDQRMLRVSPSRKHNHANSSASIQTDDGFERILDEELRQYDE